MKTYYKLPNGKSTINIKRMIASWRKLGKTIAKTTNSRLSGFDPDFLFVRKTKKYDNLLSQITDSMTNASGQTWAIPTDIAISLYEALTGKEFRC